MKQKQIVLLFGAIVSLLSSCQTKNANNISFSELQIPNTNETISANNSISTNSTDNLPSADSTSSNHANTPFSTESASSADSRFNDKTNNPTTAHSGISIYNSIYAQIAADTTSDSVKYALIYLDSDTIPELVVYDAGYDTYSLYTINDNTAFCMADSFTTVQLSYFEQTSIICSFARWNGGGDEGGYSYSYYQTGTDKTLTNISEPILSNTYNAVYNDNDEFTGEGITNYYHLGTEIDEASYQTLLHELGIEQGGAKDCIENTFAKDEFLCILDQ